MCVESINVAVSVDYYNNKIPWVTGPLSIQLSMPEGKKFPLEKWVLIWDFDLTLNDNVSEVANNAICVSDEPDQRAHWHFRHNSHELQDDVVITMKTPKSHLMECIVEFVGFINQVKSWGLQTKLVRACVSVCVVSINDAVSNNYYDNKFSQVTGPVADPIVHPRRNKFPSKNLVLTYDLI